MAHHRESPRLAGSPFDLTEGEFAILYRLTENASQHAVVTALAAIAQQRSEFMLRHSNNDGGWAHDVQVLLKAEAVLTH